MTAKGTFEYPLPETTAITIEITMEDNIVKPPYPETLSEGVCFKTFFKHNAPQKPVFSE